MTTSMTKTARNRAALNRPKNVDALILFAEDIVMRLTDAATFARPVPTLATVNAAIEELKAAQAVVFA